MVLIKLLYTLNWSSSEEGYKVKNILIFQIVHVCSPGSEQQGIVSHVGKFVEAWRDIYSCMKNTAMQIENDTLLASGRVSAVQAPVSIC